MTWATVLAATAGCYLLKLAGLLVPGRLLASARLQRVAGLLPLALLAALIAVQTFSSGARLGADARAAGLAAALIAVLLRAPFLVVVAVAVGVTAVLRTVH